MEFEYPKEVIESPILREARMEDCEKVRSLQERFGLEADSWTDWKRLWQDNPIQEKQIPIGWVLEDKTKIVGFFGNVPVSYFLGEQNLKVVSSRGWVVDPKYRSHTLKLLFASMNQKNIDIIINSSSNETAFKIFNSFQCRPIPLNTYGKILFWILNEEAFFSAALKKKNISPLANPLARLFGNLFKVIQTLNKITMNKSLKKISPDFEIKVLQPREVGKEFDDFWSYKILEKKRFLADRRAPYLNWHFSGEKMDIKIIACYKQSRLEGYIALFKRTSKKLDYIRYQIIDLIALDDNLQIIQVLLARAYQVSREDKVDALEITGFTTHIQRLAKKLGALSRKSFQTPFTYKLINKELSKEEFSKEELWYPCLYDGDSSL